MQYNGYPSYYGGYQPYYPDSLGQLKAQQAPQPSPIIWVQGEQAARAYMVAAGNTVLLMDSESSTFYLKSTDQSGMPQPLRIFDYTERVDGKPAPAQSVEYATKEELQKLEAKVEALIGGNEK